MNTNNIILIGVFVVVIIAVLFSRSKYQQAGKETTIIKEIVQAPAPSGTIYKKFDNKYYVTINGNTNNYRHDFQSVIKNIQHVEVVSAIVPKSMYRINSTNDVIPFRVQGVDAVLRMTHGVYETINHIQLELNRQIRLAMDTPGTYFPGGAVTFPINTHVFVLFDSMVRKCYIAADNTITGPIEFLWGSTVGTCARAFGFTDDAIVNQTTTYSTDFVDTSILFQTSTYDNSVQVNNLPKSYYTGLSIFPAGSITTTDYDYAYGQDRVNISLQLFIDISAKELTYFDGDNVIQQVYIPEDQSIVNYQRQYPIYRRLRNELVDLDHVTLNFKSIVEPGVKTDYDFNGIDYSVQLEIVTKDLELNATR
jgi:hypothetical protein